jgi:hypothetical protein
MPCYRAESNKNNCQCCKKLFSFFLTAPKKEEKRIFNQSVVAVDVAWDSGRNYLCSVHMKKIAFFLFRLGCLRILGIVQHGMSGVPTHSGLSLTRKRKKCSTSKSRSRNKK